MTRRELAKEVKTLIAIDKLKEAIDLLLTFIDDNQIIVQSSNYHHIVKEVRIGTMSWDDSKIEKNRIKYIILEIVDEISLNTDPIKKQENIISLLLSLGYKVTENRKFRIVGLLIGSFFILGENKIKQLFYLLGLTILIIAGVNIYFMIDSKNKTAKIHSTAEKITLDSDTTLREIHFFCDYPSFDSVFVAGVDFLNRRDFLGGVRSLAGYDLSYARLDNRNFGYTGFTDTNLSNSSCINSDFREARFWWANLTNCNFSNAFLSHSRNYGKAKMTGVVLLNSKTYEKNWINNLIALSEAPLGANEIEKKYYVDTINEYKDYDWYNGGTYYLIKEKQ